jgi:cation transport regulator ChaC
MTSYVFGYGSLLERASRTRTNPDAVGAWPARVTGYQRGWFHQFADSIGSTCTYLGAIRAKGETINGVVYPVNDIEATKQRETGYTAIALTAEEIRSLTQFAFHPVVVRMNSCVNDLSSPAVHLRTRCERDRQGSERRKCVAVRPASRSEVTTLFTRAARSCTTRSPP